MVCDAGDLLAGPDSGGEGVARTNAVSKGSQAPGSG